MEAIPQIAAIPWIASPAAFEAAATIRRIALGPRRGWYAHRP
jgi:hypothetical protein